VIEISRVVHHMIIIRVQKIQSRSRAYSFNSRLKKQFLYHFYFDRISVWADYYVNPGRDGIDCDDVLRALTAPLAH